MKPTTKANRVESQSEAGPSPVTNPHSKNWLTIPYTVKSLLDGGKRDPGTARQQHMHASEKNGYAVRNII